MSIINIDLLILAHHYKERREITKDMFLLMHVCASELHSAYCDLPVSDHKTYLEYAASEEFCEMFGDYVPNMNKDELKVLYSEIKELKNY